MSSELYPSAEALKNEIAANQLRLALRGHRIGTYISFIGLISVVAATPTVLLFGIYQRPLLCLIVAGASLHVFRLVVEKVGTIVGETVGVVAGVRKKQTTENESLRENRSLVVALAAEFWNRGVLNVSKWLEPSIDEIGPRVDLQRKAARLVHRLLWLSKDQKSLLEPVGETHRQASRPQGQMSGDDDGSLLGGDGLGLERSIKEVETSPHPLTLVSRAIVRFADETWEMMAMFDVEPTMPPSRNPGPWDSFWSRRLPEIGPRAADVLKRRITVKWEILFFNPEMLKKLGDGNSASKFLASESDLEKPEVAPASVFVRFEPPAPGLPVVDPPPGATIKGKQSLYGRDM